MNAYFYDAVRTARGRLSEDGGLKDKKPTELVSALANELMNRYDQIDVGDLVLGCVTQSGEQGGHIARTSVLTSNLPNDVSDRKSTRQS